MAEKGKTGLQRKTKAELIDIILRKDNIHANLIKVIESNDKNINNMLIDIKNLQEEIDNKENTIQCQQADLTSKEELINELQDVCDNYVYDIIDYKDFIKTHRLAIIILLIVTIFAILF